MKLSFVQPHPYAIGENKQAKPTQLPLNTEYLYRHLHPPAYHARRCRIVVPAVLTRDPIGRVQMNVGHESVAIEFSDTQERTVVQRQTIVPVDTKLARQILRKVARR